MYVLLFLMFVCLQIKLEKCFVNMFPFVSVTSCTSAPIDARAEGAVRHFGKYAFSISCQEFEERISTTHVCACVQYGASQEPISLALGL